MEVSGIINTLIDNKNSETHYEVMKTVVSKRFEYLNLVKLSPKTGRRHQLRKHMLSLGNPILGDKEYCNEKLILNGKGMYLHAGILEFIHPFTKQQIKIKKDFSNKFKKIFIKF